jgi:hypothetical protein
MTIIGIHGTRNINTPDTWGSMAPISKVLWIHDNHRDITGGKRFDIVAEVQS